jgi:aryl-alcohol dehydrogenase-like predicted oxidoreductase
MLPDSAYLIFAPDLRICRLLNGLWQLSGAHGHIEPRRALSEMPRYHDAGFTTWDLADHYGAAEEFIGSFREWLRAERGEAALAQMQAFTKWVPRPDAMPRSAVEAAVDRSRRRMQTDQLDLLQFHWWEYRDTRYLDALKHLSDLREAGKVRHLALTNFDTLHLQRVVERGVRIVSNQVQYSIIDRRPEVQMSAYCTAHNIWLLTYGTLCGGLLTDRYLGAPEPSAAQLNTASLRKYKQMIDAWGSWSLFQALLRELRAIADKHAVSIANVAVRYVLDKPAVAGVIIGARLGISEQRAENARCFSFALDADDRARIDAISAQGRDLFRLIGDCGDEYRR